MKSMSRCSIDQQMKHSSIACDELGGTREVWREPRYELQQAPGRLFGQLTMTSRERIVIDLRAPSLEFARRHLDALRRKSQRDSFRRFLSHEFESLRDFSDVARMQELVWCLPNAAPHGDGEHGNPDTDGNDRVRAVVLK